MEDDKKYEWKEDEYVHNENVDKAIEQMFEKRKIKITLYDIITIRETRAKQITGKERELVDDYVSKIRNNNRYDLQVLNLADAYGYKIHLYSNGKEFQSDFPEDMNKKLELIFYQNP